MKKSSFKTDAADGCRKLSLPAKGGMAVEQGSRERVPRHEGQGLQQRHKGLGSLTAPTLKEKVP